MPLSRSALQQPSDKFSKITNDYTTGYIVEYLLFDFSTEDTNKTAEVWKRFRLQFWFAVDF